MLKDKLKKRQEEQKNKFLDNPHTFMDEQIFIKPFTLSQFTRYVRLITGELEGNFQLFLICNCVVDKEGKPIFNYDNPEDIALLDSIDIKEANDLITLCTEVNNSPDFEKKDLQTEALNTGNTESL